jgi:hypothetical protein
MFFRQVAKFRHKKKKNFEVLYLWLHNWNQIHKFGDLFFPSFLAIENLQYHFSFKILNFYLEFRRKRRLLPSTHPPTLATAVAVSRRCLASYVTAFARQPPHAARSVHASPEEACSISYGDGAFPRSTPPPRSRFLSFVVFLLESLWHHDQMLSILLVF